MSSSRKVTTAKKSVKVIQPQPKEEPAKAQHPPTSEMVNTAIEALNEKKGSSLQAIKKYIAVNFLADGNKQSNQIKKYLKSAVEKNIIIRTKGIGANGRFKLGQVENKKTDSKPVKKQSQKKPTAKRVVKPVDEKPKKETKSPSKVTNKKESADKPTNAKPKKTTPSKSK